MSQQDKIIIEEEVDVPTCCGKHCDETKDLLVGMGWNKYYSSVSDMITKQLWCNHCYSKNVGHTCKSCSEYYPYTEMTYKQGWPFGDSHYGHDQFFCKSCVNQINYTEYILEEYDVKKIEIVKN